MKHGTIVRNMWQPSCDSFLVYTGTSGKYAKCLWIINGEFHGMHRYYKNDILTDREHFPVVGYVDINRAITDVILQAISMGVEPPKEET